VGTVYRSLSSYGGRACWADTIGVDPREIPPIASIYSVVLSVGRKRITIAFRADSMQIGYAYSSGTIGRETVIVTAAPLVYDYSSARRTSSCSFGQLCAIRSQFISEEEQRV
jgi:hypothetical protein